MIKCSGCKNKYNKTYFIDYIGKEYNTCNKCRERFKNSNKDTCNTNEQSRKWKEDNKEYVSFMNKLYRDTKNMSKEDRHIYIIHAKKEANIENKVIGKESIHRKNHTFENDIEGKRCSVETCKWKPLSEYNYSSKTWDNLRTTCKECLVKKRINSKDIINANYKKRIQSDIEFKIRKTLQLSLNRVLKSMNSSKNHHTMEYLGCTTLEFKNFIEAKFTEGMTWNNHGFYYDEYGNKHIGWHLDHIIPCIAFNLLNEDEIYLCFYYKNYQPLWGIENIKKGGHYNEEEKQKYIDSVKNEIFGNKNIIIKPKENILKEIEENNLNEEIEKQINIDNIYYAKKQELENIKKEAKEFVANLPKKELTEEQMIKKEEENEKKKEIIRNQINDIKNDKSLSNKEKSKIIGNLNKSLSKIGTKISDEALMKCYQTRKYGIENKLAKKVCKLSLDGELIQIYDTITIAAKENNTHNSSITNCCLGNKLTSGGFKWKYFDDDKTKENLDKKLIKESNEKLSSSITNIISEGKKTYDDSTNKKRSNKLKEFNNTEQGKEIKKQSLEKRLETFNKQKELIRENLTHKICTKCKIEKEINQFNKKSDTKDGYQPYCRSCINLIKREKRNI